MATDTPADGPMATVTHARLRAAQGDVAEASALLEAILRRTPGHAQAREMLEGLRSRSGSVRPAVAAEPLAPPEAGDARRLASVFRAALGVDAEPVSRRKIRALERWLTTITRPGVNLLR